MSAPPWCAGSRCPPTSASACPAWRTPCSGCSTLINAIKPGQAIKVAKLGKPVALPLGAVAFVSIGVRAVRVVAEGGAWLDPAVTARVLAIYRAAPQAAGAGRDKDLDGLTSRELEVLALIGRGKTNGEIAAGLFVSEGTVKTHINHVFTKLRLRDRAAAVVFAFDHGLVKPPG